MKCCSEYILLWDSFKAFLYRVRFPRSRCSVEDLLERGVGGIKYDVFKSVFFVVFVWGVDIGYKYVKYSIVSFLYVKIGKSSGEVISYCEFRVAFDSRMIDKRDVF